MYRADNSDTCEMDGGFCEITWFQSNNMSAITSCNTTIGLDVFIGTYGALLVAVWVLSIARSVLFYVILLRAATVLHNKMFISVLRSPILFFDTNSVGTFGIVTLDYNTSALLFRTCFESFFQGYWIFRRHSDILIL